MMKPDSKYHQTGMTTVGMALILAVVIFISTVVIKLVPVYLEHFNVTSVLNAVKEDPELGGMTDQDIRKTLTNRFTINDINGVEAKQVKIARDAGHVKSLSLDYEERVHLFWNIDAVVHFNEDAEVGR